MVVEAELVVQSTILPCSQLGIKSSEVNAVGYLPNIRSGSFADIGPRRSMEDEHIKIDDLSSNLRSLITFPEPSAIYAIFDGHGGPDASAYLRGNAIRFLFEDANFPQASEVDEAFLVEAENSLKKGFLLADMAMADDSSVSSFSGTTALAALVIGRLLMVANAGDCRAVLCRRGEAIEMSQDHRPSHPLERKRVEELGGFIDDGYLNGVISVTRALGDWDMKLPRGSHSPLTAEPELRHITLTEEDEFLVMGCDGIWDVISSQQAVSLVRRGLRRHNDPERCARDLVMEALRCNTSDNLTVIVVCFGSVVETASAVGGGGERRRLKYCSFSAEALCSLRSFLEGN